MKLTIQHVELHVMSLDSAKDFYVNKLGLEILEEIPAIQLMALRAGQVRISVFGGYEPDPNQNQRKVGAHLVFQTDNIEDTYEELINKGVLFDNGITEAPGFVRFISTKDPDGNKIEFGQYLRDPLEKRT